MDTDLKVRLVLLFVAGAVSVLGVFLAAHGLAIPLLEETGGGPH